MATVAMQKVFIAGFKSEAEDFLRTLQGLAVFHPVEPGDHEIISPPDEESPVDSPDRDRLHSVEEAVFFMKSYLPKKGLLARLKEGPKELTSEDFFPLATGERCSELLSTAERLRGEINSLMEQRREITTRLENLEPLKGITLAIDRLPAISRARFTAAWVSMSKLAALLGEPLLEVQVLEYTGKRALVIAAVHHDDAEALQQAAGKYRFEAVDLTGLEDSPDILFKKFQEQLEQVDHERAEVEAEAAQLAYSEENLLLLLEYLLGLENRRSLLEKWILTPHAFIMTGWIKKIDREALEAAQEKFSTVAVEYIDAAPGEEPPVVLDNPAPAQPFELITRLYSFPKYGTVDPSAVTGIFFALFFGLCLTDAGYGLILALLALYGIRKFHGGRDLLWILFWGGLATVGAGLATGGIFGDLFRSSDPYLAVGFLGSFRDTFLIFDPMTEPMSFFRLVLFVGLVHVVTGLVIGTYRALREKRFLDALADHASWLVIVLSLVGILFASDMCIQMALVTSAAPPLPAALSGPAAYSAGFMACVVFLFGGRDESSLFFRLFIGFLKLVVLSGIFSYLGDILSYIRLMALGMVTAGIGMAINTIAFMLADVPVVGVVLTGLILILGHTFNMAINLLGGFVHTLRLQYVEFFSKFFTGGGTAYKPVAYSNRYVKII